MAARQQAKSTGKVAAFEEWLKTPSTRKSARKAWHETLDPEVRVAIFKARRLMKEGKCDKTMREFREMIVATFGISVGYTTVVDFIKAHIPGVDDDQASKS